MKHLNLYASALCAMTIALGLSAGHSQTRPSTAASNGEALYQARCGGCHSIAANRIGPAHRGVVGRRAGTSPGFAYSTALRGANIVWTPQNLDRWLQGPRRLVPGVRMFTSVANPTERAAIIAYLGTQRN